MKRSEYTNEINNLAKELLDNHSIREIFDNGLCHEYVDGHTWIIYTKYHQDVLDHSNNADAIEDVYSNEDLGRLVSEKGWSGAKAARAYYAMYQDLTDALYKGGC